MVVDTHNYLGFIYRITHKETGRFYVGKKQAFFLKQPKQRGCKSVVTDRASPKFKSACWRESDWRTYTGSSKAFTEYMKDEGKDQFTFEIIRLCRSKSHLHYAEVEAMVELGVLWKLDSNGDYLAFNRQIPATRFRIKEYNI